MCNMELRNYAKAARVRLWEIADYFSVSEPTITRKLRHELSRTDSEKYYAAVDAIKEQKRGESA